MRFAGGLLKRQWTGEDVDKYLGKHEQCYLAYGADESVSRMAASGGTTSALLIHSLNRGVIDGALVCAAEIREGKVRPRYFIASTQEEILSAQGSKYIAGRFMADALPLIRAHGGSLAVVGLPCDIAGLRRMCGNHQDLNDTIRCFIGLICGHNSQEALTDHITEKLQKKAGASLTRFQYSVGHWRGRMRAEFDDGTAMERHSYLFKLYHNLFFFAERKCLSCSDHFAYHSDLSLGDVWSPEMKRLPEKYNSLIVRTGAGAEWVREAIKDGRVIAREVDAATVLDGQSRIAPFHYNVRARSKAGKLLRVALPDAPGGRITLASCLAALAALFNWKWSQGKASGLIFKIPRVLLKLYLVFFKGLQSFK